MTRPAASSSTAARRPLPSIAALGRARALLLPSASEGLPRVAIEAFLRGRAVVGSRAGGIPDIVRDGENGLLVPYGDESSLAQSIVRYLDDHALAARLGAAARTRAAVFDDRTYAANVIAALRESVS